MPWYVVYKGKVPGVYDDWEECRRQVHHFSGNSYKGYTTRAEAESRYARYLAGERRERSRNLTLVHDIRQHLYAQAKQQTVHKQYISMQQKDQKRKARL